MKKVIGVFLSLLMILSFVIGCTNGAKQEPSKQDEGKANVASTEITVSAAASLKDAMEEIKSLYEVKKTGVKLTLNFGSSGALQQQIEQGAPVDLFISAGKSQMDALEEKQMLVKESRVNLLGNDLVLIVGKDNNTVKSFADLSKPDVKHVGIGNPESVPAGKYAKEALTSLKLWDGLKAKYVEAKDVRQVLSYVETGNAEAGLVYKSDASISDKVKVAAAAPADSHKPIVYPAAVISDAKNSAVAGEFLEFLQTAEAQQIFSEYGFKDLKK